MALRVVLACCLVVAVSAQYGGYAPKYAAPEPYDAYPRYEFQYGVNDPHTYDVKSQQESRDGDYVKGSYELLEPDGTRRVVEYYDEGYGFQATVHRTPAHGPAYAAAPAYSRPAYAAAPAYSRPAYAAAPAYSRPAYAAAPAYRPSYPRY